MFYEELIEYFNPAETDKPLEEIAPELADLENLIIQTNQMFWDEATRDDPGFFGETAFEQPKVAHAMQGYTHPNTAGILKAAKRHATEHVQGTKNATTLVLVHPFYIFTLGELRRAVDCTRARASQYLGRVKRVCRELQYAEIDIVLVEDPARYLLGSRLLVERGIATDVIFTRMGNGSAIDKADYEKLGGKKLYAGGMYADECFRGVLNELVEAHGPDITVVPDLTFDNRTSLRVRVQDNIACMDVLAHSMHWYQAVKGCVALTSGNTIGSQQLIGMHALSK